jgi:hypothetical protein
MFDRHEETVAAREGTALHDTTDRRVEQPEANTDLPDVSGDEPNNAQATASAPVADVETPAAATSDNGVAADEDSGEQDWHAEAGRKGARRVHQLIQAGRLYEQEHGLKSGRQRLRQLIELGKLYEQEHGLQSRPSKKRSARLSRLDREELLATFLQCLLRIAKPSFRKELLRLAEVLQDVKQEHAA